MRAPLLGVLASAAIALWAAGTPAEHTAPDDGDRDGVIDSVDTCPGAFNPGQHDLDGDGAGDLCDPVSRLQPARGPLRGRLGAAIALAPGRVAVGAPGAERVYVLRREPDGWELEQTLVGPVPRGARFGAALALDGDLLLVGAPGGAGTLFLYARRSDGWHRRADLRGRPGSRLGTAVALSEDTIAAGAPGAGEVLLWSRERPGPASEGVLGPARSARPGYGSALALAGGLLAVGAPASRRVEVFERSRGGWILREQLHDPGASGTTSFGASLALDGERLLVGAPAADHAGVVYVFLDTGPLLALETSLRAPTPHPGDRFGSAVALAGSFAVVTAPGQGAIAHRFALAHEGWSPDGGLRGEGPGSGGLTVATLSGSVFLGNPAASDGTGVLLMGLPASSGCGDVDGDGFVGGIDVLLLREFLAAGAAAPLGPVGGRACNTIGTNGCDIADAVVTARAIQVPSLPPGIAPVCAAAGNNGVPVADAGPDQVVDPGTTVSLDGTGSRDPDSDALSYSWTLLSVPPGSAAVLLDPALSNPDLATDLAGIYVVQLVVHDGLGPSSPDTVQIVADLDSDGDGTADLLDCDPEDPLAHPGTAEVCGNDRDEDCSGIDDDLDADGDGFVAAACGGDDVDDTDPARSPRAPEVCDDLLDNNGDGRTDLADPTCRSGCDRDGDGHASGRCGGSDPADDDPSTYPGAPESCEDFADNDGNGALDEGCGPGPRLGPENIVMVESDRRALRVLEDGALADTTAWIFQVDGVEGGSDTLGTIDAGPGLPAEALYTAPPVATPTVFTLSAVDPADPARADDVSVTVVPLSGSLQVLPPAPDVALAHSQLFRAGIDVAGIGFVPLRDVVWRVNDVPGGGVDPVARAEIGRISADGLYTAPSIMPDPVPFAISVGFSFDPLQPSQASAPVQLAELIAQPPTLSGLEPGVVGTLSATLQTSDGASVPVLPPQLTFGARDPAIASVDAVTGDVSIGDALGQTVVLVSDAVTGATDTVSVISSTDVSLAVEVRARSPETAHVSPASQDAALIEYTCPRARFDLRASITPQRGPGAGEAMTGRFAGPVSLSADSAIFTYRAPDPEPLPLGVLATLGTDSGHVQIGDQPGAGMVTLDYDDGVVQKQAQLTVSYARPEISAQVAGRLSGQHDPFITEDILVSIQVLNTAGLGGQLSELPLRVEILDATGTPEEFESWQGDSPFSGHAASSQFVALNFSQRGPSLDLTATSTMDPLDGFLAGSIEVVVTPLNPGLKTLRVHNLCDPNAPPVDVAFTVRRPALELRHVGAIPIDSPWVVGSWLQVSDAGAVFNLYAEDGLMSFARNDTPLWTVTSPGGAVTQLPVVDDPLINVPGTLPNGGRLSWVPPAAGDWTVFLGLGERNHLRTEELHLNVVEPTEVTGVALVPQPDGSGGQVPATQTFASYAIVQQPAGRWAVGEPLSVVLRTYNATETLPRTIGKVTRQRFFVGGELQSETSVATVMGVRVQNGDVQVVGPSYPTIEEGRIDLTLVPLAGDPSRDFVVFLEPHMYTGIDPAEVPGLPVETFTFEDGVPVGEDPPGGIPLAIADFVEARDRTYLQQCLLLQGRGVVFTPRLLPITRPRVTQAISEGRIPAGSDRVRFAVSAPGSAFPAAIAGGVAPGAITGFPPGVVVEQTTVVGESLEVTLDTRAASASGRFDIQLQLNDGLVWEGPVQLVELDLDHPAAHQNLHLPLNGDHHQFHPVGTTVVQLTNNLLTDPGVPNSARFHLFPSLDVGSEDFRGQTVDQPLIGFHRERSSGAPVVSGLLGDLRLQENSFVLIYGNVTDRATLDPVSGSMNLDEGPDGLADFVSPTVDAETVAVSVGGNFADAMSFSAFNFTARALPDDPSASGPVDFDTLAARGIDSVYSAYAGDPRPASGPGADSVARVDTETSLGPFELLRNPFPHLRDPLKGGVPAVYHAGVLDQHYLNEVQPSASGPWGLNRVPLGQDGRASAFDGEHDAGGCVSPTGSVRRCFGLELDGVLYDPSLVLEDESPNDQELIDDIPLVLQDFLELGGLTPQNLFPDAGGTSGGWFDLENDSGRLPGASKVVSRTPGASYPGLHATYLIQGRAEDLTDPYFETVKDDAETVSLQRDVPLGPLVREVANPLGLPIDLEDRRRAMTFGSVNDSKAAIGTALHRVVRFSIETDPPGVQDITGFRAAVHVRELPRDVDESLDLVVTTQSDGWEDTIKLGYDHTIDFLSSFAAGAVMTKLTAGTLFELCKSASLSDVVLKGLRTRVERYTVDALGRALTEEDYFQIDGTPLYGRRREVALSFKKIDPNPLMGLSPVGLSTTRNLVGIVESANRNPAGFGEAFGSKLKGTIDDLTICGFAKLPFSKVGGAAKGLVSRESLGGGGAARATGSKILTIQIPPDAALVPLGRRAALFQVDAAAMITPDVSLLLDASLAPPVFVDEADRSDEVDLVRTLLQLNEAAGPDGNQVARSFLKFLRTPHHAVKRVPRESLLSAFTDDYEDYRISTATVPVIAATVTPAGNVSDFQLHPGQTVIPVTLSTAATALRSNPNATARAAVQVHGLSMSLQSATLPSPFDPEVYPDPP